MREKEREVNASGAATGVERVFVRMHSRAGINTYHLLFGYLLLCWCRWRFGSDQQLLDKLQRNKNHTRW